MGHSPWQLPHVEFSVENTYTYLGPTMNHEVGGMGKPKAKSQARQSKTTGAKLHSNGTTAIIWWPTAVLPVNSDY